MQSIEIDRLIAEPSRHLGERVVVAGWFVLGRDDGYLVATPEDRESKHRAIVIDVPELKSKLLSVVPPLGGGRLYYLHQASVVGTVSEGKDRTYACALQAVEELIATVAGETFFVQFVGGTR